jgi:hypothetical protein
MANILTNAIPLMAFRALEVLRENSIMPKLVMNESSELGVGYGKEITINDLDPLSTRSVVPDVTFPSAGFNNLTSTSKTITLDKWEEVAYPITDKEIFEVQDGIWPRALDEAVKALANKIDVDILTCMYQKSYETVGTAGVTPFQSSFEAAQQANRVLASAKAPKDDRYFVVDEFASSNIIGLPELINVNRAGTDRIAMDGTVEGVRRVGFMWHEDQNMITHTPGVQAGNTVAIDASASIGASTIILDNGAGADLANLPVVGDKFTIAGSTQKYTVLSVTANTPTTNETTITIQPPLDQNVADGDLVTFETTPFVANLFFHKSAFAFASRPLADNGVRRALATASGGGESRVSQTINDPISGLVFRLEVINLHKQAAISVDALYGYELIRPALAGVCFG